MVEADLIRQNNHKIPMGKISGQFLIPGFFNYPPVMPWLMSYIPRDKLFQLQGFIAPIFDILHNILVFFITYQLTGNIQIAVIAQLVYATQPLAILENSYLTPRSLGYLSFTLAFYPTVLFTIAPKLVYIAIAVCSNVFILFTHKFPAQTLLFITIFFTIVESNPIYCILLLTSVALALIVSRGYYRRIFHGHLSNIIFWYKNVDNRWAHQVRGLKKEEKSDFVSTVYTLLMKFGPVTIIGTNLWIVIPVWFFLDKFLHLNMIPVSEPIFFKLSLWVTFCYIFGVLVLMIKQLLPIGEGQRYLEMAFAPTAILAAVTFYSFLATPYKPVAIAVFVLIVLVNLSLTLIAQWKGIFQDKSRSLTRDMDKVFTFLNKMKPLPKVFAIPHYVTTIILFNTKAKVLIDIEAGTLEKIADFFPVLKKPVYEIAGKYDLDTLVLKKTYVSAGELGLKPQDLLFESGDTQIYKVGR